VAYTGTHDNDTTVGWFQDLGSGGRSAAQAATERQAALRYLGAADDDDGREIHWHMIRAIMGSVADVAIFPAQDLLGLGSAARMNHPGTATGNWSFRLQPGALTPAIADRLRTLTETYGRLTPLTSPGEPTSPEHPNPLASGGEFTSPERAGERGAKGRAAPDAPRSK
jgi:4-alpha-glucanotransferase